MRRRLATYLLSKGMGEGTGMFPWLYKIGSQFLIDKEFPLHLYLELSRSCNYQCKMCVREKNDNGYMPLSLVTKVVEEVAHYGATSFSLHLYGEPLLSPNWESAVKIIKEIRKDNVIILTTNGSLMDGKTWNGIVNSKVDIVYISVPSLEKSRYMELTGFNNLDRVSNHILGLMYERNKQKRPYIITRVYEEITKGGGTIIVPCCDKITFRKFHNFGGDNTKYTTYGLTNRYPCYHPWFTLGITYDGKVSVCCSDYHSELLTSNVYTQTLKEIWQSPSVQHIRESHLTGLPVPKCAKCDVWNTKPDIFFKWQKG